MKTTDNAWQPVVRTREDLGVSSEPTPIIPLLKADRHQWGEGQIHQINPENDTTLCGQSPARCPGTKFWGPPDKITCKQCIRSREAKEAQEARSRAWEEQQADRQAQWEDRQERWRAQYAIYLQSNTWRRRRQLVLEREGYLCEGCREHRATQAHHLNYPQNCPPGSPEWIDQEMLFDLIALCERCHKRVHRR